MVFSTLLPYAATHIEQFKVTYNFTLLTKHITLHLAHPLIYLGCGIIVFIFAYFQMAYALHIVKTNNKDVKLVDFSKTIQSRNVLTFFGKYTLMMTLVVIGLVCLVVPGVIISFALAYVPYIAIDKPHLSVKETFMLSKEMIKVSLKDYFALIVFFIPHEFIDSLTFRLYSFHLEPYRMLSFAQLYLSVYQNNKG